MKQNKFRFESENLQVDYLTFNIQGTADFDLVNRIAKYLFHHFAVNSIISNCSKNKNHLFFSDKNKHQVEFAAIESNHLIATDGNFVIEKVLNEQKSVSTNIKDNTNNNNGLQ